MTDNLTESEFSPDRARKPLPMPTESDAPPSAWRQWLGSQYEREPR